MNKILAYILSSMLLCVSCKLAQDTVPDAHPNAKILSVVLNTTNQGNSGTAVVRDSVSISDEIVKIKLQVISAGSPGYLYMMYASDSGVFAAYPLQKITNAFGTFTAGSSSTYSLSIPNVSTFDLEIPVALRTTTAALNETYKFWITEDEGDFTLPAKNKLLGLATLTLIYKNGKTAATFSKGTTNLGSQSSGNYGSFLTTAARIGTLDDNAYNSSPASADIRLVTLNGTQKDNNSNSVWLYSPADVAAANPAVIGQADFTVEASSKTTYFAPYTGGSAAFNAANTATLEALTVGTSTKSINIKSDSVYAFQTQEGKKGLIKINSLSSSSTVVGTGSTTGQNANVTVKILN